MYVINVLLFIHYRSAKLDWTISKCRFSILCWVLIAGILNISTLIYRTSSNDYLMHGLKWMDGNGTHQQLPNQQLSANYVRPFYVLSLCVLNAYSFISTDSKSRECKRPLSSSSSLFLLPIILYVCHSNYLRSVYAPVHAYASCTSWFKHAKYLTS